jgi:hypothetical protein
MSRTLAQLAASSSRLFAGMNGRAGRKGVKRRPVGESRYIMGNLAKGIGGYWPSVQPHNLPLYFDDMMEQKEQTADRLKRRGKGPPKKGAGNKKRKKR